jgi:urea transport system substrate-binding protein
MRIGIGADPVRNPPRTSGNQVEARTAGLTRRELLGRTAVVAGGLAMGHLLAACAQAAADADTVRIGFVPSSPGSMPARLEMERNCMRLAVEELNAAGGLHGRHVEVAEAAGKTTTERVARLLDQHRADVIVGLLTDADRAATAQEVARLDGLLIDAAPQAAAPCERRLVAMGPVPSQQVGPMVDWVVTNVGRRVLVLGSGDAWSRSAADAIRSALRRHGQAPAAIRFVRDDADLDTAVADSYEINPDVHWSLLEGYDALRFGMQLGRRGSHALVVASRWDELEAAANRGLLTGALTSQPWFTSLDTAGSRDYVARYQSRFGSGKPLTATGEAISVAVKMYAAAAGRAGSIAADKVLRAFPDVEVEAARGPVRLDSGTRVAVGDVYIGRVTAGGAIQVHDRLGRPAPSASHCGSA